MRLEFRREVRVEGMNLRMIPKDDTKNHETWFCYRERRVREGYQELSLPPVSQDALPREDTGAQETYKKGWKTFENTLKEWNASTNWPIVSRDMSLTRDWYMCKESKSRGTGTHISTHTLLCLREVFVLFVQLDHMWGFIYLLLPYICLISDTFWQLPQ